VRPVLALGVVAARLLDHSEVPDYSSLLRLDGRGYVVLGRIDGFGWRPPAAGRSRALVTCRDG